MDNSGLGALSARRAQLALRLAELEQRRAELASEDQELVVTERVLRSLGGSATEQPQPRGQAASPQVQLGLAKAASVFSSLRAAGGILAATAGSALGKRRAGLAFLRKDDRNWLRPPAVSTQKDGKAGP